MQKTALLLLAMLGLAQIATASSFGNKLFGKHHKKSPAPVAPPVVVSGARVCQTVPEVASNFTILLAAAKAAGLDSVLADPELVGTLFAPTDSAFEDLLTALDLSAEELLSDAELLGKVLKYHFVPAEALTSSMLEDGQKLPTLLTAELMDGAKKFEKDATLLTVDKVIIKDLKSWVKNPMGFKLASEISIVPSGGAPAKVVAADIPACNVIVHVVDAVLIPDLEPKKPKAAIAGVPSGFSGHYGSH